MEDGEKEMRRDRREGEIARSLRLCGPSSSPSLYLSVSLSLRHSFSPSFTPHSPFPIPDVSVVEITIEADVGVDFDRVIFRADAHVRERVAQVSTFDNARAPAGVDLYFARQRNLAVEK